jgi:hypothetical protein
MTVFGRSLAGEGEFGGQTRRAPSVEHPYRQAMVAAGAVTRRLRRVQETLGRGDELVMAARAEQ